MAAPKDHLVHYRDGRRMALCGRYSLRVVVRRAGAVGPAAILGDGLEAGPMTTAAWGCCPSPRRPGELLTRGDVCHVHPDRAAAERCGALLGGAPELVRLDEVGRPDCGVAAPGSRRPNRKRGGRESMQLPLLEYAAVLCKTLWCFSFPKLRTCSM